MTPAARSEVKEDVLPLQRALPALKDARSSLKQFGKVKKTRKPARGIARRWFENSIY